MPPRTSPSLSFAGLLVLLLGFVVGCSEGSGEPTVTGSPAPTTTTIPFRVTGDDFYTPPDPLPAGAHGDLIWAEEIEDWWGSPRRAWRVLYRSEALDARPIAVSGFVIAPPADAPTVDGGRPVVAWAHETVGSADACAPSRQFADAPRVDGPGRAVESQLTALVDAGAVIVASDYEGLGTPGPHPFLVGASEGRGVLDAVLAARQLPEVDAGARTVVYGASQGGHAALWAAQLAPQWAPDLDLLGAVAAAPFSEVDLLLPAAAAIPGGEGYVVLGAYGQAAANPTLSVELVLEPAAIQRAALVEEACLIDVSLVLHQVALDSKRPVGRLDGFGEGGWPEQLASIKPGQEPIASPILVVQGSRDLIVPVQTTDILVDRLCGDGDTVQAVTYPNVGHSDVVIAADADVRAWIDARLAGEAAPSTC